MSATDRLDAIEARAAKGATEVIRVCSINERVRMSIPADTERDTDLILIDVCDSVSILANALRVALQVHQPQTDSLGSMVTWSCCTCGSMEVFVAEDGYNSIGPARYPCQTVRAITAALGGA